MDTPETPQPHGPMAPPCPFHSPQRPLTAIRAGISQSESCLLQSMPSAPCCVCGVVAGAGGHHGSAGAVLGHGGAGRGRPWHPGAADHSEDLLQVSLAGCPGCAGCWRPSRTAASCWRCPSPCAGTVAPGRWCRDGGCSTASTACPAKGVRWGAWTEPFHPHAALRLGLCREQGPCANTVVVGLCAVMHRRMLSSAATRRRMRGARGRWFCQPSADTRAQQQCGAHPCVGLTPHPKHHELVALNTPQGLF